MAHLQKITPSQLIIMALLASIHAQEDCPGSHGDIVRLLEQSDIALSGRISDEHKTGDSYIKEFTVDVNEFYKSHDNSFRKLKFMAKYPCFQNFIVGNSYKMFLQNTPQTHSHHQTSLQSIGIFTYRDIRKFKYHCDFNPVCIDGACLYKKPENCEGSNAEKPSKELRKPRARVNIRLTTRRSHHRSTRPPTTHRRFTHSSAADTKRPFTGFIHNRLSHQPPSHIPGTSFRPRITTRAPYISLGSGQRTHPSNHNQDHNQNHPYYKDQHHSHNQDQQPYYKHDHGRTDGRLGGRKINIPIKDKFQPRKPATVHNPYIKRNLASPLTFPSPYLPGLIGFLILFNLL